jgi:hypothetical protein
MAKGLSVSGVVNVTVTISPIAAGRRSFGTLLIMDSSSVIDVAERVRFYANLDQVAEEHGTTSGAYLAANLYFSQAPRPSRLYIGRWAQAASSGILHGGILTPSQLDMATWTAVTSGGFTISVNGTPQNITTLNLSSATNLNMVASLIQAAMTGVTVTYDAVYERFDIRSNTTGASSTISYATAPGSGTNLVPLLHWGTGDASEPVPGIVAETALAGVQAAADASGDWYGVVFGTATLPSDNDLVDVAAYIEGSERSRIIGVTDQASAALDPLQTTDIGSRLKALRYKRSFVQFSRWNKYAAASAMGRAFTTNFEASNTTMTLKFKQEPGVVAESLTETQARTLRAKNINVFVNYDNDTAIIQEGVMSNGYFFDEVHGTDWLQNAVQVDVWNLLYQSQTKIPQTDNGITQIVATVEGTMSRAVTNGLCAPGLWGGPAIGALQTGQALTKGYYVYAPLVASQSQADREARKAPTLQVALKLAGAVHFVDVIINVNR